MGLDIHVMPLWKFWSGQFESPLADLLGAEVNVVRVGGGTDRSPEEARGMEETLQQMYREVFHCEDPWSMDDHVAFSKRYSFHQWDLLRAFAAYAEHPPKSGLLRRQTSSFACEGQPHKHESLRAVLGGKETSFEHLIYHEANAGIYIPVDFPKPIPAEHGTNFSVGSSIRLAEEVEALSKILITGSVSFEERTLADEVQACLDFMRECCQASLTYRMPVVLDG